MDGITRDFTVAKVDELIEIVKEEVEEEGQFFVFDWFEDTFITQQLDVRECLDDIKGYHSTVIDKHNIGYEKLQLILDRVATVDQSYSGMFGNSEMRALAFAQKVRGVAGLLSYGGLSLTPAEMRARIDGLNANYAAVAQYANDSDVSLGREIEVAFYEEPEWWEAGLSAVGGFFVSLGVDVVVDPILTMADGVVWFGNMISGKPEIEGVVPFSYRETFHYNLYQWEQENVRFPQYYYGGRAVGDAVSVVVGLAESIVGLGTLLGGITIGGVGALAMATGVGAAPGGAAVAVSVPAVATGAAVMTVGLTTVACAWNNFGENLQRMAVGPDEYQGKYRGGRNDQEMYDLGWDPAKKQYVKEEVEVGLGLEERGEVSGLRRDPSGRAEFIDANGQLWDVKGFRSNYSNGYSLNDAMDKINASIDVDEWVMLDTRHLSAEHQLELMNEIARQGLNDKVLWWP